MNQTSKVISVISKYMVFIAGCTLLFVMILTVVDVILRYFGRPILGVYDLVALGGAIVITFTMPYAAEKRVHVYMEMAQILLSGATKRLLDALTRLVGLGISVLIAWNLVGLGLGFRRTGEVSLTIQIAYWPIAIGMAVCFIFQALVFVMQVLQVFEGGDND